jgi:acyl dehydratase
MSGLASRTVALTELAGLVGSTLGVSQWHPVTQQMVDAFAETTGDRQWIHVDPVRAASGPYGGPIAHGLLTLSMVPMMIGDAVEVTGADLIVNRGFGKVSLANPVPVGSKVRGTVALAEFRERPRRFHEAQLRVTVEVDGTAGAALKAETVFLYRAGAR